MAWLQITPKDDNLLRSWKFVRVTLTTSRGADGFQTVSSFSYPACNPLKLGNTKLMDGLLSSLVFNGGFSSFLCAKASFCATVLLLADHQSGKAFKIHRSIGSGKIAYGSDHFPLYLILSGQNGGVGWFWLTADFCEKWLKHQQICCLRIEYENQKSKNKNANRTFLLLKHSPHFNHITQMVTFLLSNTRSPLSSQSLSIGSQSSRPRTIRDIFFYSKRAHPKSWPVFHTHYL